MAEKRRAASSRLLVHHNLLLLFFLLPCVLLAISPSLFTRAIYVEAREQAEFDYFLLALQWPGTACQNVKKCCSTNGCCRSDPLPYFTIHGLWPNYNSGGGPSCCTNYAYDENKISDLLVDLEKYWPSLGCGNPSVCSGGKGSFWAHEWEKHGTCASPVIEDEYSFFSKVLDLYSTYNITNILYAAGISASDNEAYPAVNIVSAIKSELGASPLLVCNKNKLKELRICFDKEFKPRDCVLGLENLHMPFKLEGGELEASSCSTNISLPTFNIIGHLEMDDTFATSNVL